MRETVAKRRPMIDLEQFERRLRQPNAAGSADEDPLAELARLVGGQDDDPYKADPYKAVFEQKGQQPSAGRAETHDDYADAYESERWREPTPDDLAEQERLISGNFASIEAGLRGTGRPQQASRPDDLNNYPTEDRSDDWRYQDDDPYASGFGYEPERRSRRPLYIMAAIIFAGIGGIGATFALKGGSSSHQIAMIKAVDGPVKIQPEGAGKADAPGEDASILNRTPQAAPVAVADGAEQPVDLSQMPDRAPRVIAMNGAQSGAASVPVPAPPAHAAQTQSSEPLGIAGLIEPKKVKTISVRPDGTLLPNDQPPQTTGAPPPAASAPHQPSTPTAKAATPKSTARVATTPKPVASGADAAHATAAPTKAKPVQVAAAQADDAPVTASPVAGGGYAAQLAAPASEQEAREIQMRLIKKYGGEIPGFHPAIRKAISGEKTVYRVRSVGLSKEEATALCQKVQSSGGACFVAKN
ncbi:conserved hypothetical protein [Methylocella tundrae]|uniref:SPOR domain-containing protein n=1 Tax=Methylocella tundrae TaxID=227605 RepID=A0A8B6MD46_METTU|nr:SPOR domain-containing protein [Methylocella tundrae]VTZ26999.1 conserved hypothetical protein [Methylocella tundrae]VTZ52439.1 conserved hypothetical protein [Methylocella tundrae]